MTRRKHKKNVWSRRAGKSALSKSLSLSDEESAYIECKGSLQTVVFSVRAKRIRVISARPMSRNERKVYEEEH